MDENGGIGIDNTLPWPRNKEDMQWFKDTTSNGIVVMGYNTWRSLPKALPNRINVVLSRSGNVEGADATIHMTNESVYYYMEELQRLTIQFHRNRNIFIIGGKATYELLLPLIDKWYITQIEESYKCDTYLSKKDLTNEFSVVSYSQLNDYSTVEIYRRAVNKL